MNQICLELLRQCEAEGNEIGALKLANVLTYLSHCTVEPRNTFERMFCACLGRHPVLLRRQL